jgi:CBS domain-containing protein
MTPPPSFDRSKKEMTVKIADLMSKKVITANPHHTVQHVRGLFERNRISAVPVVGPEGEALGIVTTSDLVKERKANAVISSFMTQGVAVVPAYNDASTAARMMRKRKIHHIVVTHEKKVVGMISSFDLLKLVEEHTFALKNPPPAKKANARRA